MDTLEARVTDTARSRDIVLTDGRAILKHFWQSTIRVISSIILEGMMPIFGCTLDNPSIYLARKLFPFHSNSLSQKISTSILFEIWIIFLSLSKSAHSNDPITGGTQYKQAWRVSLTNFPKLKEKHLSCRWYRRASIFLFKLTDSETGVPDFYSVQTWCLDFIKKVNNFIHSINWMALVIYMIQCIYKASENIYSKFT